MSIEKLAEELSHEKAELEQGLAETKQRTRELNQQLKRVEASLAALKGKSPRKKPARKKPQSKPPVCPTIDAVRAVATEILRQEGALDETRLEGRITERLREQGQPAAEVGPILQKALEDQQFENSLSGWKLVEFRLEAQASNA